MRKTFGTTAVAALVVGILATGAGPAAASPYNDRGFADGGPSCSAGSTAVVIAESALSKIAICRQGGRLQYIGQGLRSQNWLWIDDVRLDGGDTYLATHEKFTYTVRWGSLEIDDPGGRNVSHEHLDMHVFEHD